MLMLKGLIILKKYTIVFWNTEKIQIKRLTLQIEEFGKVRFGVFNLYYYNNSYVYVVNYAECYSYGEIVSTGFVAVVARNQRSIM